MTPHYHINLFWHEPDGCWIADVPDLGGCSAHGETPSEAAREVQIAIALWLEVEPRYRPAIYAIQNAA